MNEYQEKWIRFRLIIIFFLFVFLLTVVAVRAYQLQILDQTKLVRIAEKQRKRTIKLRPSRGIIYDRKGNELAVSVEVDSVYAHPRQISEPLNAAKILSKILELDIKKLLKKLKSPSPFVWIKRGISPSQADQIRNLSLSGIHFLKENKRFYPNSDIGGHLLGFVGVDGKGLEGLECKFNSYLAGWPQYLLVERDALGHEIISFDTLSLKHPRGQNLILTIDLTIQYILEKELQKSVQQAHAKGGMGIIMNPKTGEILGLALQPSFNPNNFRASSPHIWRNRAVTDCFDPGSTFKVFLAAAAIEEGLVTPQEIIYCENGSYQIGKKVIHDIHKYKHLSFAEVIKYSSNIGAVKVSERMDAATFYRYIRGFGFGEKTGVDFPGESPGMLRPYQNWREIDKCSISFGQGISVTAIQLINGLCAIANGGCLMKPYIVKAIVNENGEYLKKNQPKVVRRVISEKTAKIVTELMKLVVSEDGTGKYAQVSGFEVAGKTGTAQKFDPTIHSFSNSKLISSFMGFVPANDPLLAILIVIDEPEGKGFGGAVAAPAFKAIAQQALSYLKVFPQTKTFCKPILKNNRLSEKPLEELFQASQQKQLFSNSIPDFTGLSIRRALQVAKEYNLTLHIEGTGRAISQKPEPGTPLKKKSECWVIFKPVM
ncbi:MAG: penicillin-binding protein [Deltaproteobacteria bacterium]|nr:MAG: penicillin-binding protein [Deltaproteobacteria bacterium]